MIVEKGYRWPSEMKFEVVERKGLGHPDTIMDSIVEEISKELSKYYIENFGMVLHHNVDKGVLVAGKSKPKFGGGEVLEKIRVLVAGRVTTEAGDKKVPIEEIFENSLKNFLKKFRFLKREHIKYEWDVKMGSVDLRKIFELGKEVPLANDTSIGISFYPLTDLERAVLNIEKTLNSKEIKERYPFIGEDIKVLGIRENERVKLIVAVAFVDKFVESKEDYIEKKEKIKEIIERKVLSDFYYDYEIEINVGDKPEEDVFYLTVTGTSAEAGDDGQVGRGNRVNGLITPCRAMSIEATAGKNPRSHVGKIYNVWAKLVSREIYQELDYKNEIFIASRIGHPITEPLSVCARIYEKTFDEEEVERIIRDYLSPDMFEEIEKRIIEGKEELF